MSEKSPLRSQQRTVVYQKSISINEKIIHKTRYVLSAVGIFEFRSFLFRYLVN